MKYPFSPSLCVSCLARDDPNIPDNIERPISFAQFGETILGLILNLKEEEGMNILKNILFRKVPVSKIKLQFATKVNCEFFK